MSVGDSGSASSSSKGSSSGHAGTSSAIETLFGGASVDVSGSHSASSTSDFLYERAHREGQSDDHFESSSRGFSNPNGWHAVTYFFDQINETQTVRFKIVAIQRRVIDPAADTRVSHNAFIADGGVSATPNALLATDAGRLKAEEIGRASALARQRGEIAGVSLAAAASGNAKVTRSVASEAAPISKALKAKALAHNGQALVKQGLIDKHGQVSEQITTELSFERKSSLLTPGTLVKGCFDDCDTCELSLDTAIEPENKRLQNERLKK